MAIFSRRGWRGTGSSIRSIRACVGWPWRRRAATAASSSSVRRSSSCGGGSAASFEAGIPELAGPEFDGW